MTDYSKMSNEELQSCHMQKVNKIAMLDNFQSAKKVTLNSAYGAIG
jgi:DNA polymerase elongation subunit (family B)